MNIHAMNPPSPYPPPVPTQPKNSKAGCWIAAFAISFAVIAMGPVVRYLSVSEEAAKARESAMQPPPSLSDEQRAKLLAFGHELAAQASKGEGAALNGRQDFEEMLNRVTHGLEGSEATSAGFRQGFLGSVKKNAGGILAQMAGQQARCIRTGERNGFPAITMRVIMKDTGAVSFIDVLARPKDDSFVVIDAHTYVFGFLVTEEMRNTMALLLPQSSGAPIAARLLGLRDAKGQEGLDEVLEMMRNARTAKPEDTVRAYQKLSASLQEQRMVFVLYIQALMNLEGAEHEAAYKAALRRAKDILGENSGTDLLMVDLLYLDGDFKGVEQSLADMQKVVGEDAYLKILAANACIKAGDIAGAERHVLAAEKLEPELAQLVDLRLTLCAMKKDFAALVKELRAIKKRSGVALGEKMLGDPVYAEFLKSSEFAAWKKENGR